MLINSSAFTDTIATGAVQRLSGLSFGLIFADVEL